MVLRSILITLLIGLAITSYGQTWDEWFRQKKTQRRYNILQIAKLQAYLSFVKEGYKIAKTGLDIYGRIKEVDFNLHDLFFESLKTVKPPIAQYSRVQQIREMAQVISNQSSKLTKRINNSVSNFNDDERMSISFQQRKMLEILSSDLAELESVVTGNNGIEMTDNERLSRISEVYQMVKDKRDWVNSVYYQCSILDKQRSLSKRDLNGVKKLYE